MAVIEKAKRQILNIIQWIVNLIILGLISNLVCADCESYIRRQFVDAVVFGFFFVNTFIVMAIFIENQEFDTCWRLIVVFLGDVLFSVAGSLILTFITSYGPIGEDTYSSRIFAAGILCLMKNKESNIQFEVDRDLFVGNIPAIEVRRLSQ